MKHIYLYFYISTGQKKGQAISLLIFCKFNTSLTNPKEVTDTSPFSSTSTWLSACTVKAPCTETREMQAAGEVQ